MKGKWALVFLLSLGLFSCSVLKKEKPEEKRTELQWEMSRPRPESPRSATTYTARPYVAPQTLEKKEESTLKPSLLLGPLKYKLVILPFEDSHLEPRFRGIGQRAQELLQKALQESQASIPLKPEELKVSPQAVSRNLWDLWRLYGVQGLIRGRIKEILRGEEEKNVYFLVRLEAELIDTQSARTVKLAFGQSVVSFPTLQGKEGTEKALEKALDEALKQAKEGILLGLSNFEWTTSVLMVKDGEIYLNAGKNSGLRIGQELEVYSVGPPIRHPLTGELLGRSLGPKKASIKITGFLGLDNAQASLVEGSGVKEGDLIKLKE
jgi:hypothetical protein